MSRGEAPRLLVTVFSAPALSRFMPIAMVVGTMFSLVNQDAVIAAGDAMAATPGWRVMFNGLVPFCCRVRASSAAGERPGGR